MKSSIAAPSLRNSGFETTSTSRTLAQLATDRLPHLIGSTNRYRRFVDDNAVVSHVLSYRLGNRQYVLQIG
jgi:hypothetical protein